jgi:copper/silver efflux system protein
VLIFPTIYAMSGGLLLQWLLKYNFSVVVAVGYIALFGMAVETGVVMVVYLHESLERRAANRKTVDECRCGRSRNRRCRPSSATKAHDGLRGPGQPHSDSLGIGHRLRCDEADCCTDRGRHNITSAIHVLILVPLFFVMMKERAIKARRTYRGAFMGSLS